MSTKSRRQALLSIASVQAGYFTASQALDAGYSYQAQRHNVIAGNWIRVDRGIFRLPEWPVGPHEDLVRWTLWSRSKGVISHLSALSVYELGDVNPARIHLTVPRSFRKKAKGVVLHKIDLPRDDVQGHEGFAVTTPMRSILDAAADGLEIDQLARAIEDALEQGLVTKKGLRARADAFGPAAALAIERALTQEAG